LAASVFPGDHGGLAYCRQKLALPTAELNPQPMITGDDLVARGLKPGKYFGELLDFVRDAQLEQKIHDQREAFALVDQWLANQGSPE